MSLSVTAHIAWINISTLELQEAQLRHMKLLNFYISNSAIINPTDNPGRQNSLNVDIEVESHLSFLYLQVFAYT